MRQHEVILLTGGTGKVGRVLLQGFSSRGCSIVFATRNAARATSLQNDCMGWGASAALALEVDLSTDDGAASVVPQLIAHNLYPTVLINNARSLDTLQSSDDGLISRVNWHGEFQLGVVAAYQLTMACASLPQPPQSVVNISSMYGVTAANRRLYENPDTDSAINYGVVKSALIHLTKELAVRLAPSTRVNAISFGGVRGRVSGVFEERYSTLCPAGRMLNDDDIFGPVAFLSGSASSGMTGHNLVVDGGWTIW